MKRFISICLLLALLCGCSLFPAEERAGSEPATMATEYIERNPLNGAATEVPVALRPVAVMVDNTPETAPQHGISLADILYEMPIEGGATCCMAIYSDITYPAAVGVVTRVYPHFLSVAKAYDALLLHAGNYDDGSVDLTAVDHLNNDPTSFFLDEPRLRAGYAKEHCNFVHGPVAMGQLQEKFDMTPKRELGLQYSTKGIQGESAGFVQVSFGAEILKATVFYYDSEKGNYVAQSQETGWIDGATNQTLRFENLLLLNADLEPVGSGEGYYCGGGHAVAIKWSRESEDAPFVYTLADGSPLRLLPGKTYVAIAPQGSPIDIK